MNRAVLGCAVLTPRTTLSRILRLQLYRIHQLPVDQRLAVYLYPLCYALWIPGVVGQDVHLHSLPINVRRITVESGAGAP